MIPKPNRRRERAAKIRARSKRRSAFHEAVIAASGGRCENRLCISVLTHWTEWLHAHHIIHRSQGGKDTKENGIALCPICHACAHNGYTPINGDRKWITANEFVLAVMGQYEGTPHFRWAEAREYLQKRSKT